MTRRHALGGVLGALALAAACARPTPSLPPSTLAAADPAGTGSAFEPPPDPLRSERPRTLDLEIEPPAKHRHEPEAAPEIGSDAATHEGHDSAPQPSPTPTPKAYPSPPPVKDPDSSGIDAPPAGAVGGRSYTCPMHPEVRASEPGECPKCGMPLEPVAKPSPTATPKPTATPGDHDHHDDHQHDGGER